jgi:two-component system, NarL family, sensor kinase
MVKINLFFLCTLFMHQSILAQAIFNADSLEIILSKTEKKIEKQREYLTLLSTLANENLPTIELVSNWLINSENNDSITATAYRYLGKVYKNDNRPKESAELFNKSLAIAEKNNLIGLQCDALNGLYLLFESNEQAEESLKYLLKEIEVAEKNNYKKGIASGKFNLATMLDDGKCPEKTDTFYLTIKLIKESIKVNTEINELKNVIIAYGGLAEVYAQYEMYDSAVWATQQMTPYLKDSSLKKSYIDYYFTLGKIFKQKGKQTNNKNDLKEAIKYFDLCLPIAINNNDNQHIMFCYDWMGGAYRDLGDYKKALEFKEKYIKVNRLRVNETHVKELLNIQHKYEKEKKDKEILTLSSSNKQKSTLNKILIGSAAALLFIGFLGYRNFRSRQKLQQAKITELEKDKQLSAIDAMLQGQEEERSRIAKDLHDGLGGMLSGTKLSFINMKENLVLTPENAVQFDKSISMLDNTIADLRKVAHNLMPEALVKFGLQEAVRDFCNSIQSSTNLKVVYQPLGDNRKLSNTAEVFTYRIIQELVNNAVKHANATQIIVQLTNNNNKVGIAVEDDGKGFDVNALANSKGAGMDNIKYRVQYFNGTIDTVTSAGNGTSVNIELSV